MATRKRVLRVYVFAAALAIAATATASSEGARTLVSSTTRINSFAQDGRLIAWVEAPRFCRTGTGFMRDIATGQQHSFHPASVPVCGEITLARGRALWTSPPTICGNCVGTTLWTASFASPNPVRQSSRVADPEFIIGQVLTGLAGGGRLPAFSWVRIRMTNPTCLDQPNPSCTWGLRGGGIMRVRGDRRENQRVSGVGRPALLATGAGRVAIAPAKNPLTGGSVPVIEAVADGPVLVVNARTAAPVVSVSPIGTARALALSRDGEELAVLVRQASGRVIEHYAIPSGTLLTTTSLPDDVSIDSVDISQRGIVYRAGHGIHLINRLGNDRLLITIPSRPIGVSIEGRRVAWGQNSHGHHRIRAILLGP